jgi:hypothetical protein
MYKRVIGTDGYPIEQVGDILSRRDEILIQLDRTLRELLGGVPVPPGGGNGGTIPPAAPILSKNLYVVSVPLGATANVEVRYQFPAGTKQIALHTRNGNAIRIASEPGKVAGSNDPYFTLKANNAYCTDNLNTVGDPANVQAWYFACSVASEIVEIILGV